MQRRDTCRHSLSVAVVALACACTRVEPQPETPVDPHGADIPAVVHAHLDSASAAWKSGEYALSRAHFRIARDSVPDLAAAWFGLYLTERALGDSVAADSAFRTARRLATADSIARPRT